MPGSDQRKGPGQEDVLHVLKNGLPQLTGRRDNLCGLGVLCGSVLRTGWLERNEFTTEGTEHTETTIVSAVSDLTPAQGDIPGNVQEPPRLIAQKQTFLFDLAEALRVSRIETSCAMHWSPDPAQTRDRRSPQVAGRRVGGCHEIAYCGIFNNSPSLSAD